MARNPFVIPSTTRLELSDGEWVEVKSDVTWSEEQAISGAMMKSIRARDDALDIDWAKHKLLRMETWLIDWSFRDAHDKPVKLSRTTIMSLDNITGSEVDDLLSQHIDKVTAAKKAAIASVNGSQ